MGFGAIYSEVMRNAEHYKAIGQTNIFLDRDSDLPWDAVTSLRAGGSRRLGISTDVDFEAEVDGLTFRWTIDIEEASANGKSHYQIAVERIGKVMEKLPESVRGQFRLYLLDAAHKVEERGDEFQGLAQRQYGDAHVLRSVAGK